MTHPVPEMADKYTDWQNTHDRMQYAVRVLTGASVLFFVLAELLTLSSLFGFSVFISESLILFLLQELRRKPEIGNYQYYTSIMIKKIYTYYYHNTIRISRTL